MQLQPGYVICSIIFLLLGLASLSSSINLLVLRFMILSLEEDAEEFDLQDVTQNVITVDDEYINGPAYARRYALRQPETVSVCSCTCYPSANSYKNYRSKIRKSASRNKKRVGTKPSSRGGPMPLWKKWLMKIPLFSRRLEATGGDDEHYFDEETMSISNAKKFATKRNSL